jgi:hypothetical protein
VEPVRPHRGSVVITELDEARLDAAWLRKLGRIVVDAFEDLHCREHGSPLRPRDCTTCVMVADWRRHFAEPLEAAERASAASRSGALDPTHTAVPVTAAAMSPSVAYQSLLRNRPGWMRAGPPRVDGSLLSTLTRRLARHTDPPQEATG